MVMMTSSRAYRFGILAISILLVLLSSLDTAADQGVNNDPYSPEALRARFKGNNQSPPLERLKAMQADTRQLTRVNRTLYYTLPNGSVVLGMLLPNGKKAPAIQQGDALQPACVTASWDLVAGVWDEDNHTVQCAFEQEDVLVVDSDTNTTMLDDSQASPDQDKSLPAKVTKYHPRTPSSGISPTVLADSNYYRPSPRKSTRSKAVGGVMSIDQQAFGIPIGSWGECELTRPVSSAESGFIELVIKNTVSGKRRSLPASTKLFANKQINELDERMEATITKALLPDGEEINLEARIYSLDKTAGLRGQLTRDREGEVIASSTKAGLAMIGAATPTIASIPGTAIDSVATDAINNERRHINMPRSVIRVSPQPCLFQMAKSL